jgi:short-subunit dehydrogenase
VNDPARILITGASSGLGRALAIHLAKQGKTVIATARREERLAELAKAHPTIEPYALDVTDAVAVAAFIKDAGALDVAILNAAVNPIGDFDGSDNGTDAAMLETNVMANIRLARALKSKLSGGRLVFVGSMAGFVPLPGQAVYSGTKAFIQNWALALREEWRAEVSVGLFAPGGIKTEMTESLSHMEKHLADVESVAADLARFIASDKAMRVPGFGNRVSARLSRLFSPTVLSRLMRRVYKAD